MKLISGSLLEEKKEKDKYKNILGKSKLLDRQSILYFILLFFLLLLYFLLNI